MTAENECGFVCSRCGAPLLGDEPLGEHCLTCLLDAALDQEEASAPDAGVFDHYRLATHPDGTPVELGRGAMGITYRAFEINLRCPVALKVIGKQYLGNEAARRRFLGEARAAASVRHSNIASVFHLGRSGENYFYAMEFVDGETLESLIRRRGRLDVELALDIMTQVAAGLNAIHKQHLVHRDIKPSNIMLSWEEGRLENAKIIDLGLAKGATEDTLSIAGSFIGTPVYASPEQFAGLGTDIRSDLYSLGVALWEMLSGKPPFYGSAAELMDQHQHVAPPFEKLTNIPEPVIALLEVLLAKDPNQRFQSPAQLQQAPPKVQEATGSGLLLSANELRSASAHGTANVSKRKARRYIVSSVITNHWVVGSIPTRCMLQRKRLIHILTYVLWLSFEPARPLF
jgi:serine/threonine protein kinase